MARPKLNVSVPGETPVSQESTDSSNETTINTTEETSTENTSAPELGEHQETQNSEETSTEVNDPKDLLIAELRNEIARRDEALKTVGIVLPSYNEVKESGLPSANDIDPKSIKSMVLTQQGWVIPEGS